MMCPVYSTGWALLQVETIRKLKGPYTSFTYPLCYSGRSFNLSFHRPERRNDSQKSATMA